jgi:hypothetical protein
VKKLLFLLILLTSNLLAFNLKDDLRQNTKFNFLNNLLPSTFVDIKTGKQTGGILTEVISYRFMSGLIGITKDLQTGQSTSVGTVIGIKPEYFVNLLFKKKIAPDNAPLLQRTSIGPYFGWDFRHGVETYGLAVTIKFDIDKPKE